MLLTSHYRTNFSGLGWSNADGLLQQTPAFSLRAVTCPEEHTPTLITMKLSLLLLALVSAAVAARLSYDAAWESTLYPRKSMQDIRHVQGLSEFAPLDPDVNRTFVQIVEAKGAFCLGWLFSALLSCAPSSLPSRLAANFSQ